MKYIRFKYSAILQTNIIVNINNINKDRQKNK